MKASLPAHAAFQLNKDILVGKSKTSASSSGTCKVLADFFRQRRLLRPLNIANSPYIFAIEAPSGPYFPGW